MEHFSGANPAIELVDEGKAGWCCHHKTKSYSTLTLVGWWTVLIVCCVAIFLLILIILTTFYVISYRQKQKKKYNFGVKKSKNTVKTICVEVLVSPWYQTRQFRIIQDKVILRANSVGGVRSITTAATVSNNSYEMAQKISWCSTRS